MYQLSTDMPVSWPGPDEAAERYSALEPREILGMLRRRKLLIVSAMLLGLGLALAYLVYAPRKYTSETEILIDPRGLQVIGQEVTPAGQTSDVNAALLETHLRVLTSDSVLRQVVARERLSDDPEFNGSVRGPIQQARAFLGGLAGAGVRSEPPDLQALRGLQQRVTAQKPDRGYVIKLRVTSSDPDKAARLAQAVASAYMDEDAAARRNLAHGAAESLTGRLEDLAGRVKQAEDAVERFKTANKLVGASGQLVSEQELIALNTQLVTAQSRTSELKARFEQIDRVARSGTMPDAIPEGVQSTTIASLRGQLAEVNRLQADLATRLGPRHPDTDSIRAQAQRMRGQVNEELSRISRAARSDYERARSNEQALTRSLNDLKKNALDVSQSLVPLRELEREAQANRTVYESFLSRAREIGEQQRLNTSNARVISPAIPPARPDGPGAPAIAIAAAFGGLALGALLGLARDKTSGRIQSARQLTGLTSLRVLAVVPKARALRPLPRSSRAKDGGDPVDLASVGDQPLTLGLGAGPILGQLGDVVAEGRPAAKPIVMVTSPDDSLGKTAVAICLALAGPRGGQRTLLIDADRNGRALTAALRGQSRGLEDVLAGRVPLAKALIHDSLSGVSILPAGPGALSLAPNAPGRLRELIIERATEFDLIVIDADMTPAAGSVRAFAEIATHVLLVVQAGSTPIDKVEEACAVLRSQAAKVGAILTGAAKEIRYKPAMGSRWRDAVRTEEASPASALTSVSPG